MGFSVNPRDIRVDFFEPEGQYCNTITVYWPDSLWSKKIPIEIAFRETLYKKLGKTHVGKVAVCIEPYHETQNPVCLAWDGQPNKQKNLRKKQFGQLAPSQKVTNF